MADFTIKRGDNFPYLNATLTDQNGPINLTNAVSVKFIMKMTTGTAVTGTATIVSAAAGTVQYQWGASDTNLVGEYNAEFEITWPSTKVETVPNSGYFTVSIVPDLG